MCRCAVAWANSARCAVHIVVLARLAVHFIVSARCCATHIIVSELHIYTFLCHRCAARIVMPARCTVHAKVVLQTREDIRKATDPRRRPFRRRHDQSQSDLDTSRAGRQPIRRSLSTGGLTCRRIRLCRGVCRGKTGLDRGFFCRLI